MNVAMRKNPDPGRDESEDRDPDGFGHHVLFDTYSGARPRGLVARMPTIPAANISVTGSRKLAHEPSR